MRPGPQVTLVYTMEKKATEKTPTKTVSHFMYTFDRRANSILHVYHLCLLIQQE